MGYHARPRTRLKRMNKKVHGAAAITNRARIFLSTTMAIGPVDTVLITPAQQPVSSRSLVTAKKQRHLFPLREWNTAQTQTQTQTSIQTPAPGPVLRPASPTGIFFCPFFFSYR